MSNTESSREVIRTTVSIGIRTTLESLDKAGRLGEQHEARKQLLLKLADQMEREKPTAAMYVVAERYLAPLEALMAGVGQGDDLGGPEVLDDDDL
jgi:hypothetical protein